MNMAQVFKTLKNVFFIRFEISYTYGDLFHTDLSEVQFFGTATVWTEPEPSTLGMPYEV